MCQGKAECGRSTRELQAAARALGLELHVLNARSDGEFEAVFTTLLEQGVKALVVQSDGLFTSQRDRLVALAARYAVPAIYGRRKIAEAGGLMSYARLARIGRPSLAAVTTSWLVALCPTDPTFQAYFAARPRWLIRFYAVRRPAISPWSSRQDLNSLSISRRPKRSVQRCHRLSSLVPTR